MQPTYSFGAGAYQPQQTAQNQQPTGPTAPAAVSPQPAAASTTAQDPEYKKYLINGILKLESEITELEQLNLAMNQRR